MSDDAPLKPGTIEYAAAAKQDFDDRLGRMKSAMRDGGADLLTVIFGCAYDNNEGVCFGMDGEPNALVNIMGIALVDLAERAHEKIRHAERFLPEKNRTPFARVMADVTRQLLFTIKTLSHDKKTEKPSSGIILPNSSDA